MSEDKQIESKIESSSKDQPSTFKEKLLKGELIPKQDALSFLDTDILSKS